MNNKQVMLSIIGIAILLIGLVGITYSFFNYTREGSVNTLTVGRINFNHQETDTINLTNAFPIRREDIVENDGNTDKMVLSITGDTTYDDGIEYLVSVSEAVNSVNSKQVPIGTNVTVGNLGTNDDSYFDNRGGNTSIYKVLAKDTINTNDQLVVGYIAKGATGVNGTVTIEAWLDGDKIAISDTYDGTEDGEMGTTTEWVNGRTVFTTDEWNSLSTNGISFKVKVEANEGVWVEENGTKIDTCPGCKFTFLNNAYTAWNMAGYDNVNNVSIPEPPTVLTPTDYSDNYLEVIGTTGRNYFLGIVLNDNNEIEKAYSCGLYNDEVPFCIEGYYDGSKYTNNVNILQRSDLWNNTCEESNYGGFVCQPPSSGLVRADAYSNGEVVNSIDEDLMCSIDSTGMIYCN